MLHYVCTEARESLFERAGRAKERGGVRGGRKPAASWLSSLSNLRARQMRKRSAHALKGVNAIRRIYLCVMDRGGWGTSYAQVPHPPRTPPVFLALLPLALRYRYALFAPHKSEVCENLFDEKSHAKTGRLNRPVLFIR